MAVAALLNVSTHVQKETRIRVLNTRTQFLAHLVVVQQCPHWHLYIHSHFILLATIKLFKG